MSVNYLTLRRSSERTGRHYKTVLGAAQEYLRTQGENPRSLECYQPGGVNTKIFVPEPALDRWMTGQPPRKPRTAAK